MPFIILCPTNNELLTASWCPVFIFISVSRLQERNCPTRNLTKSSRTAWTPKMRTVWSLMSVSNRYFTILHAYYNMICMINLYYVHPNRVSSAVSDESLCTRRQRSPTKILFLYLPTCAKIKTTFIECFSAFVKKVMVRLSDMKKIPF